MKRAISGVLFTIVLLYYTLTFRAQPPSSQQQAIEAQLTTEVTTLDDAPATDAPSTEAPSPQETTSTTKAVRPVTTTTTTTTTHVVTTVAPKRIYAGNAVTSEFGPVQVQITVQGHKIVAVKALQAPASGTSGAISATAIPKLASETLAAQSTNIASVSGATQLWQAWKKSLQSAMIKSGL